MKVNKIKKLSNDKYKIELDNGTSINTFDDIILKHNLLYSKELGSQEISMINKENDYYDKYHKCISYISKKLRSEYEIVNYLNKFELDNEIQENILKELKRNNFINDISFAKAYVSDRFYLSNDGPYKIKKELINQKIAEEVIDVELNRVNETDILEKLNRLIDKKIRLNHKDSMAVIKRKIYREMINLGYSGEMINLLLEKYSFNEETNLKKEFNKIYSKLSLKIKGNDLNLKIRQKLYQKGYNLSDIDKLINEKDG